MVESCGGNAGLPIARTASARTSRCSCIRLITADTVEERIEELKARKAELAQAVLEGGGTRDKLKFDEDDLNALFAAE